MIHLLLLCCASVAAQDSDPCPLKPCPENLTCVLTETSGSVQSRCEPRPNGSSSTCADGGHCESDPCQSNPCLNGGSCLGHEGHRCVCPPSFTGPSCATRTRRPRPRHKAGRGSVARDPGSPLLCLAALALLTALVLLITTGLIFSGHCQRWRASGRYRRLMEQQQRREGMKEPLSILLLSSTE